MFHKPCKIKSQTQLKGSEKKKLVTEILENFPLLTDYDVSMFLPSKGDVNLTKAYCNKGDIVQIYQIEKEPLFFKINKDNELYPTVYFLWKFPYLVKTFTTHTPVIPKLMTGADLMLPGIEVQGNVTINSYGKFEKGTLVAINTLDNICPVAIGRTALSSIDMYMSARQGKGVIIMHIYKDYLWELGSKCPIPDMTVPRSASDSVNEESNDVPVVEESEIDSLSENLQSSQVSESPAEEILDAPEISGPEAMDKLLLEAFLTALKTTAKKIDLPVLTSNFYRLHMVPAYSAKNIDVKKSSHKKLSKFLNAMAKKDLVKVKEFPKGIENITHINYAHQELKRFVVDESARAVEPVIKKSNASSFAPPVLEELYQVSGKTLEFFRKNGLSKGEVLTKGEVREIVTSYIQNKNLQKSNKVELDSVLSKAVVNPKEGYIEYLRWDEIFSRFLGQMSPAFRSTRPGEVPFVRKGKLEPIEIVFEKRTGNKKVTLVYNLGTFGIDENEFAHQIQVGVATSTSVGAAENKPLGTTQVLIQGSHIIFLEKLLTETYKLPRKYIKGLDLAQQKKKK